MTTLRIDCDIFANHSTIKGRKKIAAFCALTFNSTLMETHVSVVPISLWGMCECVKQRARERESFVNVSFNRYVTRHKHTQSTSECRCYCGEPSYLWFNQYHLFDYLFKSPSPKCIFRLHKKLLNYTQWIWCSSHAKSSEHFFTTSRVIGKNIWRLYEHRHM